MPSFPAVPLPFLVRLNFFECPSYLPHKVKTQYLQNIKHSRYIHLMSNFLSIHSHSKRLYEHTFDIVDTLFSYGRALIVCSSL